MNSYKLDNRDSLTTPGGVVRIKPYPKVATVAKRMKETYIEILLDRLRAKAQGW